MNPAPQHWWLSLPMWLKVVGSLIFGLAFTVITSLLAAAQANPLIVGLAQLLAIFGFSLMLQTLIDQHVTAVIRSEERERLASCIVDRIDASTGLQLSGIARVIKQRDNVEWLTSIESDADFAILRRFDKYRPKESLVLIGITNLTLPSAKRDQFVQRIRDNKNLHVSVLLLSVKSDCARLRSNEPDIHGCDDTTRDNIKAGYNAWRALRGRLPDEDKRRLRIAYYDEMPYAEYEAYDLDSDNATIYYTPIIFNVHTNESPSFVLKAGGYAFKCHKAAIESLMQSAFPASQQDAALPLAASQQEAGLSEHVMRMLEIVRRRVAGDVVPGWVRKEETNEHRLMKAAESQLKTSPYLEGDTVYIQTFDQSPRNGRRGQIIEPSKNGKHAVVQFEANGEGKKWTAHVMYFTPDELVTPAILEEVRRLERAS